MALTNLSYQNIFLIKNHFHYSQYKEAEILIFRFVYFLGSNDKQSASDTAPLGLPICIHRIDFGITSMLIDLSAKHIELILGRIVMINK